MVVLELDGLELPTITIKLTFSECGKGRAHSYEFEAILTSENCVKLRMECTVEMYCTACPMVIETGLAKRLNIQINPCFNPNIKLSI